MVLAFRHGVNNPKKTDSFAGRLTVSAAVDVLEKKSPFVTKVLRIPEFFFLYRGIGVVKVSVVSAGAPTDSLFRF